QHRAPTRNCRYRGIEFAGIVTEVPRDSGHPHGVSKRTFGYLDYYAFWRVVRWLRKRHYGLNWGTIRRRFLQDWEITDGSARMFRPRSLPVTRYRYRGTKIPTPWTSWREEPTTTPA